MTSSLRHPKLSNGPLAPGVVANPIDLREPESVSLWWTVPVDVVEEIHRISDGDEEIEFQVCVEILERGGERGWTRESGSVLLVIPRTYWIQVLRDLDLVSSVSLRINLPLLAEPQDDVLVRVVEALERAQSELSRGGRAAEVVTQVRGGLEELAKYCGGDALAKKKLSMDLEDCSLDERWQLLRRIAFLVCGPSPHPEKAAKLGYTNHDSRALLAMAYALAARTNGLKAEC